MASFVPLSVLKVLIALIKPMVPIAVSYTHLDVYKRQVARGGEYLQPSLVKKICDASGETVREISRPAPTRVLPESVSRELQKMMELTVKEGTGKKADVPVLGSAGKTGSAETGEKDENGQPVNNAWFVGYAPLDKPQLAVAVFVEAVSYTHLDVYKRQL